MTVQEKQGNESKNISSQDVADYLTKNTDFFENNPEILGRIDVPHASGEAISLIERQVGVLRQENRNLRSKIRDLVDIAKENDELMARMNRLSAALVSSKTLDDAIHILKDRLIHDFTADGVAMRLIGDFQENAVDSSPEIVSKEHAAIPLFESILARGKPVCGRFNNQQLEFMFDDKGEAIKSVAVIPLGDGSLGFISIGSEDPERFRAGISTSFLSYLGEIAGSVIKRFR